MLRIFKKKPAKKQIKITSLDSKKTEFINCFKTGELKRFFELLEGTKLNKEEIIEKIFEITNGDLRETKKICFQIYSYINKTSFSNQAIEDY